MFPRVAVHNTCPVWESSNELVQPNDASFSECAMESGTVVNLLLEAEIPMTEMRDPPRICNYPAEHLFSLNTLVWNVCVVGTSRLQPRDIEDSSVAGESAAVGKLDSQKQGLRKNSKLNLHTHNSSPSRSVLHPGCPIYF